MVNEFLIVLWICCTVVKSGLVSKDEFLNAETFVIMNQGRKLTGQSCNPDLLRPCRYQNDFCVGNPSKCTTVKRSKLRSAWLIPNPKKKTTKKPVSSSTTIQTTTKIILTTAPVLNEEARSPHKRYIKSPHNNNSIKSEQRPKKSLEHYDQEVQLRQVIVDDESDQNEVKIVSPSAEVVGTLTWNGKVDEDKPCLLDYVINEKINGPDDSAVKDKWVVDHKHEICDYNKLQVCTVLETNTNATITNDPLNSRKGGNRGVCRCLESSYVLIQDTCYIPVGFGIRSGCGVKRLQYKHVPPSTGGPPTIKTKCVPNAECVSSPEYFGLRCECVQGARFWRTNHTCGSANCLLNTQNIYIVAWVFLILSRFLTLNDWNSKL